MIISAERRTLLEIRLTEDIPKKPVLCCPPPTKGKENKDTIIITRS